MEKFNEQIDQGAIHMAEQLIRLFKLSKNLMNYLMEEHIFAMKTALNHIGGVLAASLCTTVQEAIPTLLPVALQTYLVSALCPTSTGCNITSIDDINWKLFMAGKQQHGSVPLHH